MYAGNDEPTVEELLSDEMMRLLMARDRLSLQAVRVAVREARRRLRKRRQATEHAA
jgi:hypothetical protein